MNIEKIVEQVPALAVLVFVVIVFLRSQARRDDSFLGFINDQNQKFRALSEDSRRVHEKSVLAIIENTKVMGRLGKTLEESVAGLKEFKNRKKRGVA